MRIKIYIELYFIFLLEIMKVFKMYKVIFRLEKCSVKKGYYYECII